MEGGATASCHSEEAVGAAKKPTLHPHKGQWGGVYELLVINGINEVEDCVYLMLGEGADLEVLCSTWTILCLEQEQTHSQNTVHCTSGLYYPTDPAKMKTIVVNGNMSTRPTSHSPLTLVANKFPKRTAVPDLAPNPRLVPNIEHSHPRIRHGRHSSLRNGNDSYIRNPTSFKEFTIDDVQSEYSASRNVPPAKPETKPLETTRRSASGHQPASYRK